MYRYQPLFSLISLCTTYVHAMTAVKRSNGLVFSTLGDSWASGVTYNIFNNTNFDDNHDGCMRLKHAYGVQLRDSSPNAVFTFPACSGSRLEDIVLGQHQMDKIPDNANFVTVQSGGNAAGFFNIARNCVFHDDQTLDYGEEYPGPGECQNSIDFSHNFIHAPHGDHGSWHDLDDTITDMLDHPKAQHEGFKIYILGYAHLFNDADPWCNDHSFSINSDEFIHNRRVKLTATLRQRINQLTSDINDIMQDVVAQRNDPKVAFVSITEGFDAHRFCEPNTSLWDQYFGNKTWIWNASPEGLIVPNGPESIVLHSATDEQLAKSIMETFKNRTLLYMDAGVGAQADQDPNCPPPNQGCALGVTLRPFHPTMSGHMAIKEVIQRRLLADNMFSAASLIFPPW